MHIPFFTNILNRRAFKKVVQQEHQKIREDLLANYSGQLQEEFKKPHQITGLQTILTREEGCVPEPTPRCCTTRECAYVSTEQEAEEYVAFKKAQES